MSEKLIKQTMSPIEAISGVSAFKLNFDPGTLMTDRHRPLFVFGKAERQAALLAPANYASGVAPDGCTGRDLMLILAIDTALDACAAGVLDTNAGKLIAHESLPMKRGHAEALMPLLARVMAQSGIGFPDLARIAVTTGPGSFTGLRVGLSAARGVGLAASKPVVGVTTLAAYAAPAVTQNEDSPVISAIDARHDHVYLQVVSGDGTTLVRPGVVPIAEAVQAIRFGAPRLVGNAAGLLAAQWPSDAAPPLLVDIKPAPEISWVGWLGAAVNPDTASARPYYLRAPDAKPQGSLMQQAAQSAS
jgi:tRNA threonylcarbamoyladenosine biosynthesis protein TsaB